MKGPGFRDDSTERADEPRRSSRFPHAAPLPAMPLPAVGRTVTPPGAATVADGLDLGDPRPGGFPRALCARWSKGIIIGILAALLPALGVIPSTISAQSPAGWVEAPPFTVRFPQHLAAEARRIAADLPATTERVRAALDAPPLPPSTLYLAAGEWPAGPGDPAAAIGPVPEWAAGVALPGVDAIVVRTDRVGSYAQRLLDGVVTHEIVHLVMARAAGPEGADRMPRWFREGVAGHIARDGEWLDFLHLWFSPAASSTHPLATIESAFRHAEGPGLRRTAYAGAFSFISHAVARHGEDFPARVLAHLRDDAAFEDAWRRAASTTLHHDETAWSDSLRGGRRWLGILSSSFTLWAIITVLFLMAGAAKRRRARRTLESWSEAEAAEDTAPHEPHS